MGASAVVSVVPLAISEKCPEPTSMGSHTHILSLTSIWAGLAYNQPPASTTMRFESCVSAKMTFLFFFFFFFWATQASPPENDFLFTFLTKWAVCHWRPREELWKVITGGGWVCPHTSQERAHNCVQHPAVPRRFAFQAYSFSFQGFWAF